MRVLLDEGKEMDACEKVDPPNRLRYYNTPCEMDSEQGERLSHFIIRHGLNKQFMEEDAAGQR